MSSHVVMYTDGGARGNPGPAGAGAVIYDGEKTLLKKAHKSFAKLTNNQAEYEAVLLAFSELKKLFNEQERKNLSVEVRADSELVVKQLNGEYQIKDDDLVPYFMKIWNTRVKDFPNVMFVHIPREENEEADALANAAMDGEQGLF